MASHKRYTFINLKYFLLRLIETGTDMEFALLSDAEYEAFAKGHAQSNFIQSMDLARFQRARGHVVELFGVRRDGILIVVGKLVYAVNRFGYKVCEAAKGPLMDYSDAEALRFVVAQLTKHAASRKAAELRISPNLRYLARDEDGAEHPEVEDNRWLVAELAGQGFAHQGLDMNFVNINWMFLKSLDGIADAEELIMGMNYRTRKAIRKAEKNGVYLE